MARSNTGSTSNYFTNASAVVSAYPLTMAAWFKPNNITTFGNLIAVTGSTGLHYHTLVYAGDVGGDPVQAISSENGEQIASSTAGFSASVWNHGTAVFAAASDRSAYLNGANKGTNASTRSPTGIAETSVAVFKASGQSPFSPLDGSMAEAAIWNVALTDAEVAVLATGMSPLFVRPSGLVAYWPLIGRTSPEICVKGDFPLTMVGSMATADHVRVFNGRRPQIIMPAGGQAMGNIAWLVA